MKITGYSIGTIEPRKSPSIDVMVEPNVVLPICYLKKPKWLSEKQWQNVLDSIKLEATPSLLDE